MSTLREDFEALAGLHGIDTAPFLLPANIYASQEARMLWLFFQAATERAAKLAAEVAHDAAIKYANGREVDFEQEVAAAIRDGGGA